ncbi:MAG: hypothetical protein ACRED5_07785 [Propylenella sp.]
MFKPDRHDIMLRDQTLVLDGARKETIAVDLEANYRASYRNAIAHFLEKTMSGAPYETALASNLDTLKIVEEAYRMAG